MRQRIVSTFSILSGILIAIYLWGITAAVWILIALTLLTQTELYQLLEKAKHKVLPSIGLLFGFLLLLNAWYWPAESTFTPIQTSVALLILMVCSLNIMSLFKPWQARLRHRIKPTLLGVIYIAFSLQFYIQLMHAYAALQKPLEGLMLTIFLILSAKFTDIGGLLVGSSIGRNKLAPKISPKKTWEGAIGGVIFSLILCTILYYGFRSNFPGNLTVFKALKLTLIISIVSIISDLVESYIKRKAKSKDSGNMIPGIGGAFDLMDSLILTAPVGYYYCKMMLL